MLTRLLAHPLTRGLDLDDPRTTLFRRRIVREKPFLRRIYDEWYGAIAAALPPPPGAVVELGSGPGFLRDRIPHLLRSEVFWCPGVDAALDGCTLPFSAASLRGIVMTDVLHHISEPRRFFAEASRCLRSGGVIAMIEPWVTSWSRLVYRTLHHEPFVPDAAEWEFPSSGPLSGANGALPWIIFERDRDRFAREFPLLRVRRLSPIMPVCYLLSGGVSRRALMPGWSFPLWRRFEALLASWHGPLAMFAEITLERR